MSKEPRYAAIIVISKKSILDFLDFKGGIIHDIRQDMEQWNPDEISIVIEHPDLPEVFDGSILTKICPAYTRPMERVDPPKKEA